MVALYRAGAWIDHEDCEGTGWLDDPTACGDPEHCSPVYRCPNCANGLVPSDQILQAAADGVDALPYDTLELRNWGGESTPDPALIVARAALISAARYEMNAE